MGGPRLLYHCVLFFLEKSILIDAFLEVRSSSHWGILTSNENERICIEYGDCTIPFYKCIFSVLGLLLPFIVFEIEVINHLVMAPSKIPSTSWTYVKIF